jgi:predicted phage replisome organizer
MADNKKYYYLKLKENFFDSDELIMLESQPDGHLYSNILLKLYLRSLKNDGKLMFNDRIPYNAEILAKVTRHNVAVVEKALFLFEELGLIEKLDNGAIYMLDIQNFIGKSSNEADRIRDYRSRINKEKQNLLDGSTNVVQMYDKSTPKIELEKKLDLDIELDIKKDNSTPAPSKSKKIKPQKHKHGEFQHVLLTDDEFERLKKDFDFYEELIKKLDEYIETSGKRYKNHNLVLRGWVLNWYNEQGYKTARKEVEPNWLNEKPKPKEETLEDKANKLYKMYEIQLKCNQLDQAQETAKQYKELTGKDIEETKKELNEAFNVLSKYD